MEKIKVKFRGTRGSYPTPKANFLEFGGNTSCVEVNIGRRLIILDAGTGIIELGKELTQNYILSADENNNKNPICATLLLSHIHQDHIQGLPFFNPAYIPQTKLGIYGLSVGKKGLKDNIASVLYDKVFPLGLEDVNCDINIQDFTEKSVLIIKESGEEIFFSVNDFSKYKKETEDIIITAHKTFAHPKNGCLCFKIEYGEKTLVYATDKESYVGSDKKFIEFCSGANLLIHDSQYTNQEYTSAITPKQGFGHSTFQMALEAARLSKAKKLVFFHFDPNYDDEFLKILENELIQEDGNAVFAKENLEIVL